MRTVGKYVRRVQWGVRGDRVHPVFPRVSVGRADSHGNCTWQHSHQWTHVNTRDHL